MASLVCVNADAVIRHRAHATHLDARLPSSDIAAAAWTGLQDSAPRAALMSLHARVGGLGPGAWEDRSLAQIWFRRGADYVVPRVDVGVFTLGTYPRDPDQARSLEALADEVHRATDGQMRRVADLPAELTRRRLVPLRHVSTTGRVLIRWDARDIWVIPIERPAIDVEEARRELARRFVQWFAPTTASDLARFTGVPLPEARLTWSAIAGELAAVRFDGEPAPRWALESDLATLEAPPAVTGIRLLPVSDPLTRLDHGLLVPDPALRRRVLPRIGESPGFIPGALLVDGRIAGVWHRQGRRVTLELFGPVSPELTAAIEQEAWGLPVEGGIKVVQLHQTSPANG